MIFEFHSSLLHSVATIIGVLVSVVASSCVFAQPPDGDAQYVLGPDSERHDDVPQGIVMKHEWVSTVFEGTKREDFVDIPAQYDGTQPACLMVFQDGHA